MQAVRVARAKQAALTMAVALWEQEAEAWGGARDARKRVELGYRGGPEQTSVERDGARYGIHRPRVRKHNRELELPTLAKRQSQDGLEAQRRHRMGE